MPNPLRYKGSAFRVHPDVLLERPALAAKIALVATYWESLESELGLIFAQLLGGQEDAALRIFSELIDRNLRKIALLAAAKDSLPDPICHRISELFDKVRKKSGRRNAVVHAQWTILPSKPNSLLLVDHKEVLKTFYLMAGRAIDRIPFNIDEVEWNFTEYQAQDFDQLILDISNLRSEAISISVEVFSHVASAAAERHARSNLLLFGSMAQAGLGVLPPQIAPLEPEQPRPESEPPPKQEIP